MRDRITIARDARAFTLVELLATIAIISLLTGMLVPTVARTKELSVRAGCLARLSGIQQATVAYASQNLGKLFPCRYRTVQIALNPVVGSSGEDATDWVKVAATVGLAGEAWECPSRPGSCQWEWEYPQRIIGYQYFGGIRTWRNPWGRFPSRSPCNLTQAEPHWVLAADCTMKIDTVWGGGRPTAYANMPQHRWHNPWPEGGNQVYVDGSAEWVDFERMVYIHSWSGDWSRVCYFYQEDLGEFDPPSGAEAQP